MIRIPFKKSLLIGLGLVLTLFAAALVQTAEKRAARRFQAVEDLEDLVRTADPFSIDPHDEGHIVRVSGLATTDEVLRDPLFGVEVNALLLEREVESFQWVETERDGERYYEEKWSKELIDSALFAEPEGHENPAEHRFSPQVITATEVKVGEFEVPTELLGNIEDRESVTVTSLAGLEQESTQAAVLADGSVFFGVDPDRPTIGDARVSFELVPPLGIHLLGRQRGRTLEHFSGPSGPGFLVLKLERAPLFPNIDRTRPAEIWASRFLMFFALYAGLLLLGRVLSADLRPSLAATGLLAISICAAIAATTWRAYSVFSASIAMTLALIALLLALAVHRRLVNSAREHEATQDEPPESIEPR